MIEDNLERGRDSTAAGSSPLRESSRCWRTARRAGTCACDSRGTWRSATARATPRTPRAAAEPT
eukprot:6448615-Prymnesium_polylepis.1